VFQRPHAPFQRKYASLTNSLTALYKDLPHKGVGRAKNAAFRFTNDKKNISPADLVFAHLTGLAQPCCGNL